MKVKLVMKSCLSRRCPERAARIEETAVIGQPCYSIPRVPGVRAGIHLARNNVRQNFFGVDCHHVKRHGRASRHRQTICEQRAVARWVRVRECNRPMGIEFIRIKQTLRSTLRCVAEIKGWKCLARLTVTKEVSIPGFDDTSRCRRAQQLRQTSMNASSSGYRRQLAHGVLVLL